MVELVIHKQKLPIFTSSDDLVINVPRGARLLKIARQFPHEQTPYCWYACDPAAPLEPLSIIVCGTGGEIPAAALDGYLGTEIFHNGQLVFHFFRDPAPSAKGSDHVEN